MSILEIISFGFIQRAIIAGTLIAILCSVLGVFLILRRLSLIGDGLSHITFGSSAVAMALKLYSAKSLIISLPIVVLSSFGILKLTEKGRLGGDAAIGIISAVGVAFGIMVASLSGGYNVDLLSYLFGNILSITTEELIIAVILFTVVLSLLFLYFNDLFISTFNEELAKVSGVNSKRINAVLVLLTALSVILSMKLVGIMLISSLLIFPAASALQISRSFHSSIIISILVGGFSVTTGIVVSFVANIPTSATIVMINLIMLIASFLYRKFRKI